MGNITAYNRNFFKSSKYIFSRVKRLLQSYDLANKIDDGEFPQYVKDILKLLGVGVYRETQAVIKVNDYHAFLPEDYDTFYCAYKCHHEELKGENCNNEIIHSQSGFKFVTDVTKEYILDTGGCEIIPSEDSKKVLEYINIKTYVVEEKDEFNDPFRFKMLHPLRLSPNVGPKKHTHHHIHNHDSRMDEITIDEKHIHTNFKEGFVYMKYYGFPIDNDGQIEIPDIQQVENTIYWYIIYNILLSYWFDSSVPDIQNKWQKAEQEYEKAFAEAKYYLKLPSFTQMVNSLRNRDSQNKLRFMTEQFTNTNFQRTQ